MSLAFVKNGGGEEETEGRNKGRRRGKEERKKRKEEEGREKEEEEREGSVERWRKERRGYAHQGEGSVGREIPPHSPALVFHHSNDQNYFIYSPLPNNAYEDCGVEGS